MRKKRLLASEKETRKNRAAKAGKERCLACQACVSKYHFLRTYKVLTGRTPMEDVRIIRANAARTLILSTALPLKDIAPRTGLGNEYAMSRIFRHYFNMPPGAWRRRRHWHGSGA